MIDLSGRSVTRFANGVMAVGLDPTGVSDNRATLQSQWDAAAAQEKALIISTPGTYRLTVTGSGTTRSCLKPGTATDRYELWIGPGVDLKMADNQVADGNTVGAIFAIANHSGGGYIGWPYGAPTVRAQGGRLLGNTAGQTGWTTASGEGGTKYRQGGTHAGVLGRDSEAGGGSQNWVIDNIEINDFFGTAAAWAADLSQELEWLTTTSDIHFSRIKVDRCGEGLLWAGLYRSSMRFCTAIARSGINVGDFHEPSFSTECFVQDLEAVVAEGNGTFSIGGAVCDVYCSQSITVKDLYGRGVNQIFQGHGNYQIGTPQERECGDIYVDGIIAEDCNSYVLQWGAKGTYTIRNVTVKDMRSGASSPVGGPIQATIVNAFSLTLENANLLNCTSLNLLGAGKYQLRNVYSTALGSWTGPFMGAGANENPNIFMHEVSATGYPYGLQFSGTSAPTGRWTNVDFSGCTLPKLMQDTATLGSVEIPDGIVGETPALVYIGQPLGQDQQPIQGCRAISGCWTNGATYTTIPAGHKYQLLRIVPGGQPATLSPSSTLKLSGNTSVAITSPDVIELMYDTLNGYWREVSRSINH